MPLHSTFALPPLLPALLPLPATPQDCRFVPIDCRSNPAPTASVTHWHACTRPAHREPIVQAPQMHTHTCTIASQPTLHSLFLPRLTSFLRFDRQPALLPPAARRTHAIWLQHRLEHCSAPSAVLPHTHKVRSGAVLLPTPAPAPTLCATADTRWCIHAVQKQQAQHRRASRSVGSEGQCRWGRGVLCIRSRGREECVLRARTGRPAAAPAPAVQPGKESTPCAAELARKLGGQQQ